jgi:acyl dehydratase
MTRQYYEDLSVGDTYESDGRTVTQAEIIDFADRFDPQPYHVDVTAAEDSMFGGLVASGIHTFGICQRLATDAFYNDVAFLGGRGVNDLRLPTPTRPGDSLRTLVTVEEKRPDGKRANRGHVDVLIEGFNQHDELAVSWTALAIVGRRGAE